MDIDYKKLYNETLQKLYEMVSKGIITEEVAKGICADFAVESEDEKIRQFFIHEVEGTSEEIMSYRGMNKESVLAWLKKQGKQKPIENINGEDYGIDGLWHAQRILERTLGEVEGYQSDDGILEHKCAITAVRDLAKKQGEQKPYGQRQECVDCQFNYAGECKGSCTMKRGEKNHADKVEPKFKVKYAGSEYNVLEVKDIAGITYYGIEDEPNHIDYVLPDNCEIVSEQEVAWSEEDNTFFKTIIRDIENIQYISEDVKKDRINWLKSIKDRILSQSKPEQNK